MSITDLVHPDPLACIEHLHRRFISAVGIVRDSGARFDTRRAVRRELGVIASGLAGCVDLAREHMVHVEIVLLQQVAVGPGQVLGVATVIDRVLRQGTQFS